MLIMTPKIPTSHFIIGVIVLIIIIYLRYKNILKGDDDFGM
jgi:hypothetical protein